MRFYRWQCSQRLRCDIILMSGAKQTEHMVTIGVHMLLFTGDVLQVDETILDGI